MGLKTDYLNEKLPTIQYSQEEIDAGKPGQDAERLRKEYVSKGWENVKVTRKRLSQKSGDITTIDNPIKDAPNKTAFAFKTKPNLQYYLKFGYLLEYIRDNILLKIKTGTDPNNNPPIFDIDSSTWSNHMYSLPNQISLDPRVCVVRNDKFSNGQTSTPTQVFSKLSIFREIDNGNSTNENAAYPMNIYLNFNFIIECLKADERGDVNIFEFLKSICDGLNKALGGINNLEPIIDETSNTLKIVDTTPIPGYSGVNGTRKYTLQLYGYNKTKNSYISNFIRKVDLRTAITPEFATMVTVGATAGGYVKGVEATAFSRWNQGLIDRFKEEFTPGNPASLTPPGTPDEAEVNYVNKILSSKGYETRYGFTSLSEGNIKLSDDIIEGNISVGTEFFKYIVAKNKSTSGGTIGFIPFKISFTMDGLSGIKIYNKLNVDTRFLPKAYGDNLDLIVTGVSHKLQNNDWETDIEATVIPKTTTGGIAPITSQVIQETVQEVKNAPIQETESSNYQPLSSDDDLWIYLSWQQGTGGAAQHYRVATGKRKSYGLSADAILKNWPGKKIASNGVRKQDINTLYATNQKKLAIGFIDVWRQRYKEVVSKALTLINSKGKNRTGILYSEIKKTFQKYQIPSKGITWEKLARFGYIENSLNTDDETKTTYQGMFQINKTYKKNPDNVTVLNNSRKGPGHKPNYTEYDLDKYVGPLVSRIAQKLDEFKKESGYPN